MDDEKKPAGDEQDMIRWLYAQSDRPQTTNVLSLVGPALLVHPQREQIMALHQQGIPLTMRPMAPHPDDQDDYVQVYIERDDEFYSVLRFPFSALRHVESGGVADGLADIARSPGIFGGELPSPQDLGSGRSGLLLAGVRVIPAGSGGIVGRQDRRTARPLAEPTRSGARAGLLPAFGAAELRIGDLIPHQTLPLVNRQQGRLARFRSNSDAMSGRNAGTET